MKNLPFEVFGPENAEHTLYFAHANAYPPQTYRRLIEPFAKKYRVICYLQRPLWQPTPSTAEISSWHQFADDVIAFLDQQKLKNVLAYGHSLGSVTAFLAACKRPDLFKALAMIEPVMFSRRFCLLNHLTPWFLKQKVNIINKALNRPDTWHNQQQAFDFHRRTRAFKYVSDAVLWDFIEHGVIADGNQVRLRYPTNWEAHVYGTVSYFRGKLLNSALPILAFRGEHSTTIPRDFWQKWERKNNPQHRLIELKNSSHLLPFEQPDVVVKELTTFFEKHLSSPQ